MKAPVLLLTLLLGLAVEAQAQNNGIFQGGEADGFSSTAVVSLPGANNTIFEGGASDGFAASGFEFVRHNAIFTGGPSDGFTSSAFESVSHNTIFAGGPSDGYGTGGFEMVHHNGIFAGGSSDGFTSSGFETVYHNSIFSGGSADGFAAGAFETIAHNDIFAGGSGDGFDSSEGDSTLSPYSLYMLASGVYGLEAAPLEDLDSDGWNNLQEFAFGGHPGEFQRKPEFHTTTASPEGSDELFLSYPRRSGGIEAGALYFADGISYQGQGSVRLPDWTEPVQHRPSPGSLPALPPGYEYGAITMPAVTERAFLRIRLELLTLPD